jgi:hypothetical protein
MPSAAAAIETENRFPPVTPGAAYFNISATLATPAFAQASSISWLDPELPTPPIVSLPT